MPKLKDEIANYWSSEISVVNEILDKKRRIWARRWKFLIGDYSEYLPKLSTAEGEDMSTVNLLWALVRNIIPTIYHHDPRIITEPARLDIPYLYTHLCQLLLNYHVNEFAWKKTIRRSILDALVTGIGPVKLGYVKALERKSGASRMSLLKILEAAVRERTGKSIPDDTKKKLRPLDVSDTWPFLQRVPPYRFLIDPLASTEEEARWMGHTVLRPISEVEKDDAYDRTVRKDVKATHESAAAADPYGVSNEVPTAHADEKLNARYSLVAIHEIWDRYERKVYTLDQDSMSPKGMGQALRVMDWPYEIEGFPFEVLRFNEFPDGFHPEISDVEQWINPALMYNLLRSYHAVHISRFNRKYLADERAFKTEQDEDALRHGPDGAIVHVRTNGRPLSEVVQPLQDAPMSSDVYQLAIMSRQDLTMISGVTAQRQDSAPKRQTATEASIIEGQARLRDNERLQISSDFIENIAKKVMQLMHQYVLTTDVLEVAGPLGMLWPEGLDMETARKEVLIKVAVGSSAYTSQEVRVKQLLDFSNLFAGLQDPKTGEGYINIPALIQRVALEMAIPDFQGLLNQPAGPQGGQSGPPAPQGGPIQGGRQDMAGAGGVADLLSGIQNLGVGAPADAMGGGQKL